MKEVFYEGSEGEGGHAKVVLAIGDEEKKSESDGNGPVDAVIKSIKKLIPQQVILDEFLIQAITKGSDDVCKVHMRLMHNERPYHGFGSETDIVLASAKAFIDALNKLPVK
jgi:2-isopropylmalate synthase